MALAGIFVAYGAIKYISKMHSLSLRILLQTYTRFKQGDFQPFRMIALIQSRHVPVAQLDRAPPF